MQSLAAVILLVPATLVAQPLSPDAQTITTTLRSRIKSYSLAVQAHTKTGKPISEFSDSLQPDQVACRARLEKEKRADVRLALEIAILSYRTSDFKERAPLGPNDLPLLKRIAVDSPLWIMLPNGPLLLAMDIKDPAKRATYLDHFIQVSPVPEVKENLLFNSIMMAFRDRDWPRTNKALAMLEKEFPKSQYIAMAKDYTRVRINKGDPAPNFQVRTIDTPETMMTLDSFKGRYLLIDFWATWCAPCVAMMPTLHQVYATYKDKDFAIMSVAQDENLGILQKFRSRPDTPMPWYNVLNSSNSKTRARINPILDDYGIHEFPTMVLIGPDGKVVADSETLHKDLEGTLERLLGSRSVDYAPIKKEVEDLIKGLQAAAKAHRDSGAKDPFKIDPKVMDPIRNEIEAATGERREVLLIEELGLSARLHIPSVNPERLLKEVSPSSKSWQFKPDLAPLLEMLCGKAAGPYITAMRSEGIPNVRAALFASDAYDLLQEGKLKEAQAALGKAQAIAPEFQPVKEVSKMLEAASRTPVGQAAPDFRIPDIDNPDHFLTLADFKGKFLLLDFWGTWCGWCLKELPHTHKIYEKFKGRGLEILSIAKEAKAETVLAFRKKPDTPMPWRHGLLVEGKNLKESMADAYGVLGYPSLFLIGPDGKLLVKGDSLREAGLEATLEKYLQP